ncbi:hypothetical protein C8R45DRAFT_1089156 [Mycena sanguinolenta]|nr:hypothetical protein C8R45DRAFT_1089156 [Mycena sanguinolenta]
MLLSVLALLPTPLPSASKQRTFRFFLLVLPSPPPSNTPANACSTHSRCLRSTSIVSFSNLHRLFGLLPIQISTSTNTRSQLNSILLDLKCRISSHKTSSPPPWRRSRSSTRRRTPTNTSDGTSNASNIIRRPNATATETQTTPYPHIFVIGNAADTSSAIPTRRHCSHVAAGSIRARRWKDRTIKSVSFCLVSLPRSGNSTDRISPRLGDARWIHDRGAAIRTGRCWVSVRSAPFHPRSPPDVIITV